VAEEGMEGAVVSAEAGTAVMEREEVASED
jgi:hypothetical protein